MKINQLLTDWPINTVATQAWLHAQEVGPSLVQKYRHSGWLERVGHGAWKRRGDRTDWQGGVFALQQQKPIRFWPGGATALNLAGFSHYLPIGLEAIELFTASATVPPGWFSQYDWGTPVNVHSTSLFTAMDDPAMRVFQPAYCQFELYISSPERAVLELIHRSANEMLFSSVVDVFSGLATLSPRRLQTLLEACTSIRVKRVFLLLARHANHTWYDRIDLTKIDIGTGKRQIITGGRLDKQFLITVPEGFASAS